MVAPVGADFHHQARPTIALARPDPADPNASLPLNGDWPLHPALADTVVPLWRAGEVRFVPFAGTVDLSRSHCATQDMIELSQAVGGARNCRSGFLGRLTDLLGRLAVVDIGGWGTHVNQGGAQGCLAGRLGELGRGLAGLKDELGPAAWRNTTAVVVSEFGRTFRENGDHGTDHGHGSVNWVLAPCAAAGWRGRRWRSRRARSTRTAICRCWPTIAR